jgi:hypothetical protein
MKLATPSGYPWSLYESIQSQTERFTRIADVAWGLERGLNFFLAILNANKVPDTEAEFQRRIETVVASGAWNERNRARLRRKYLYPELKFGMEPGLIALNQVDAIRNELSPSDWGLLTAVAAGVPYDELAASAGLSVGTIRTRICRLRSRLRRRVAAGRKSLGRKAPEQT